MATFTYNGAQSAVTGVYCRGRRTGGSVASTNCRTQALRAFTRIEMCIGAWGDPELGTNIKNLIAGKTVTNYKNTVLAPKTCWPLKKTATWD